MPRGRPHLTSNFPMISRGSSYPEENDRDIRGTIYGDRKNMPVRMNAHPTKNVSISL
ncbi:hypothetical protein QE407_001557 [Pantoea dispersa]|nr:hypothetical protein [Pantoea dispersa]